MKIIDLRETPESIPLLAKWHHNQWSYLNPLRSLEKRMESYQDYLVDDFIPSTFVAYENDKVMGSASIVRMRHEDEKGIFSLAGKRICSS